MEEIPEKSNSDCTEAQTQNLESMELDSPTSDEVNVTQQKQNKSVISSGNSDDDELNQFIVLDATGEDSNHDESDSDGPSINSEDSDIPQDEIEAMLEERLHSSKHTDKSGKLYEEREKLVLNEIGHNHFDLLPEGWVQVTHNSGMPLYLHKQSRVCTMSKPYFLGPGSARKHEIPLSAVPCLQYRRALKEEEEKQKDKDHLQDAQVYNLPQAKIETAQENRAAQSLNGESLREYCQSLFRFKTIKVLRFESWSERKEFTKSKKQRKHLERPTLPDGAKLIIFPAGNNITNCSKETESANRSTKPWILNTSGKSDVCILHEVVQHYFQKQPTYKYLELENAATPYSAIVCINDMEHGCGYGNSKKLAKLDAAKKTLEILFKNKVPSDLSVVNCLNSSQATKASKESIETDLSLFDVLPITDPKIADYCAQTTEPSPYEILLTCLQRNLGLGNTDIKYNLTLKQQHNEYTMTVGKHTATVVCRNKKDGKQLASQKILQLLHPHIQNWGSLLRIYGSRSARSFTERKQKEQEITSMQGKAEVNQPNHAVLNKLREEMKKLAEKTEAVKPIGKFNPPDLPTGSSANLDSVDL